jgi:serine/threonine protein kinase
MEYVHGRPLDRFIAEKPSVAERRRVADELMEALIFLHDRQIVHGDLKPSNILITDSGNHVRLIDFGFADNEAYVAKNIGTSPSISTNEQLPTDVLLPERDIYALGKMLALLFPHSAKPIIHRCLASAPRRYTSIRQVRSALHRYWRMRWLLPLLLTITTIVAFFIVFLPRHTTPAQIIEPQRDTVVMIEGTRPAVDSTWLNLKSKTDKRYSALYRTYADSLKNMPVKCLNEGILMNGRYATKVWKVYNQATASYPRYAEQLYDQYLFIYDRDSKRLADIYKDYPAYSVNLNGDTMIHP